MPKQSNLTNLQNTVIENNFFKTKGSVMYFVRSSLWLTRKIGAFLFLSMAMLGFMACLNTPAFADGGCPDGSSSPNCELPDDTCDESPSDPDCEEPPDCADTPNDPMCGSQQEAPAQVRCDTPAETQIDIAEAAPPSQQKSLLRALGIALRVCVAIAVPVAQNCAPIYRGCLAGCTEAFVAGELRGNSGIRACTRQCMESYGCYDY